MNNCFKLISTNVWIHHIFWIYPTHRTTSEFYVSVMVFNIKNHDNNSGESLDI